MLCIGVVRRCRSLSVMTDAAVQSTDQLVTCDSRHDSVAVATTRRRQQVDKATNTDDNWLFSLSADVAADDEPLMSVRDNIATFPLGPFSVSAPSTWNSLFKKTTGRNELGTVWKGHTFVLSTPYPLLNAT